MDIWPGNRHLSGMTQRMAQTFLIAGPTAVGKSALALALAARLGGVVVNADALQVYDCWRILTARPSAADETRVPHHLYGHIAATAPYSVGHWLREVAGLLNTPRPLIFVGGTGLYLSSLLRGLAAIPPIPPDVRAAGDRLRALGAAAFHAYLRQHDPQLFARIDTANAMRLQRGWEVHQATGRPLSEWQQDTDPPLIGPKAKKVVLQADPDWLADRIFQRFDLMMEAGALAEVAAQKPIWDPSRPAARALGAAELMAHLDGKISFQAAVEKAKISSRQYAKRQRTWFRSNMADWRWIPADAPTKAQLDLLLS